MKYFLDTEFIEGFHKPLFDKKRHFIDLISIGIVAEDGREYYAISKDFDIKKAWYSYQIEEDPASGYSKKVYWLRENVLRPLHDELCKKAPPFAKNYFSSLFEPFTKKSLKRLIRWYGKSNREIAKEIFDFINPSLGWPVGSYNNSEIDKEPYKSHFDNHNVIISKNGYYIAQPEFFGYYCDYDWVLFCSLFGKMIDLPAGFPFYCKDLKQIMDEKGLNGEWKKGNCPDPDGEHNALIDAKWNLKLYNLIKDLK